MVFPQLITVPAAGEQSTIYTEGLNFQIDYMPVYLEGNAPSIHYEDITNPAQPLYPDSVYVYKNNVEKFSRLIIVGTDDSAGDIVSILPSDACKEENISPRFINSVQSELGDTMEEEITDVVFSFSLGGITNAEGKAPIAVYLAANGSENIRYASGVTPETVAAGNLGYDLQVPNAAKRNEPLKIAGIKNILKLRFLNAVATNTASLIYTFEY